MPPGGVLCNNCKSRGILYCTALFCTVLFCTVVFCTLLYCTTMDCSVLYCTVLYCTVLYCTILSDVLYCLSCTLLCMCCTVCMSVWCAVLCMVRYSTLMCCTVCRVWYRILVDFRWVSKMPANLFKTPPNKKCTTLAHEPWEIPWTPAKCTTPTRELRFENAWKPCQNTP